MAKKIVKLRIEERVHEEMKRLLLQGKLKKAGVRNLSEAYELAARILMKVVQDEG